MSMKISRAPSRFKMEWYPFISMRPHVTREQRFQWLLPCVGVPGMTPLHNKFLIPTLYWILRLLFHAWHVLFDPQLPFFFTESSGTVVTRARVPPVYPPRVFRSKDFEFKTKTRLWTERGRKSERKSCSAPLFKDSKCCEFNYSILAGAK